MLLTGVSPVISAEEITGGISHPDGAGSLRECYAKTLAEHGVPTLHQQVHGVTVNGISFSTIVVGSLQIFPLIVTLIAIGLPTTGVDNLRSYVNSF